MKTFLHAAKGHGMSIPDVNVDQTLYALISDCGASVREVSQVILICEDLSDDLYDDPHFTTNRLSEDFMKHLRKH